MLTDDWYPALARPDVELVADGIERDHAGRDPHGATARAPADVIVLATGLQSHEVRRPDGDRRAGGRTLAKEWAASPRAYLGITVPGFPNLFLLYGPNTNGGTGSVVSTIEGRSRT